MASTIQKSAVLEAIDDEHSKWQALVEEVGPERVDVPGAAGDWTFKDVAAHLSFWHEDLVRTLESEAAGTEHIPYQPWPKDLADPEAVNDWAYQQSKDRTRDDVLEEADTVFQRMHDAMSGMSEEQLNALDIFDWQAGEPFAQWVVDRRLFNHYYREHEEPIQAWLAETK